MIRAIGALNYRCLRYVREEIDQFQVLVGPNGSGKSTFLDIVGLIGDIVIRGPLEAFGKRSSNFLDLLWMGRPGPISLLIEFELPDDRRRALPQKLDRARYQLTIGLDEEGGLSILRESLWLKPAEPRPASIPTRPFPSPPLIPKNPFLQVPRASARGWRRVVKKHEGKDYLSSETTNRKLVFRFGPERPALGSLPEDEELFPAAIWVRHVLRDGSLPLVLDSEAMRRPSPPGFRPGLRADGSNLPWVIEDLRKKNNAGFRRWIDHLRTALPEIETIDTVEREEDRHRYLRILYRTGLRAPSWTVSDGTLRLLALTLIGYLESSGRIYLIEEPENGIHPQAVETVFQSLSSAYADQILCATHSPVLLAMAEPEQVLCFAQTSDGATDIVRGSEHPNLRDWKRSTDLGTLFATGILG